MSTTGEEKLASYTGGLHVFRGFLREKWSAMSEGVQRSPLRNLRRRTAEAALDAREMAAQHIAAPENDEEFAHVFRRKSRLEMVRISAAVMGIEFCYSAETAFVSPTLLKIGVHHRMMTLIWCLSPAIGFFLTPILGSLSDRCKLGLGRRRPFILLLSVGIVTGLLLVPNGKLIGEALGDTYAPKLNPQTNGTFFNMTSLMEDEYPYHYTPNNDTDSEVVTLQPVEDHHPWGIFFTVLGTVLLDFDADACQSPARAFLLDVTMPEERGLGLSTFTVMAGLGGSTGYFMGAIDWDVTIIGWVFGGHVRAVFTLVLFIFLFCVFCTVTSFKEIPHDRLLTTARLFAKKDSNLGEAIPMESRENKARGTSGGRAKSYGSLRSDTMMGCDGTYRQEASAPAENSHRSDGNPSGGGATAEMQETAFNQADTTSTPAPRPSLTPLPDPELGDEPPDATLRQYLSSIIYMPRSLRMLCVTNLFCWMSLVCYSLYFTDFVGEAVFGGDPEAPEGSTSRELYETGVRFGCLGMALYSLSCSCYSFIIEKLVKRFGARPVYIFSPLVYTFGMVGLALSPTRECVIIFSCTAGVMYATLFTMPYLLVAHYHATQTVGFERSQAVEQSSASLREGAPSHQQIRGLGTDVAIMSSMVFLAQFIQALCMGSLITAVGSTVAIAEAAAVFSLCGALAATQVEYLDL